MRGWMFTMLLVLAAGCSGRSLHPRPSVAPLDEGAFDGFVSRLVPQMLALAERTGTRRPVIFPPAQLVNQGIEERGTALRFAQRLCDAIADRAAGQIRFRGSASEATRWVLYVEFALRERAGLERQVSVIVRELRSQNELLRSVCPYEKLIPPATPE